MSVALTAQPSSQKPTFSSGCDQGDGTASCSIGSMTSGQTVSLDAQIAVASNATSVTSVKLTATGSVTTTATWTPPAAAETVAVTGAAAKNPKNPKGPKSPKSPVSAGTSNIPPLPLGPIPALNGAASMFIGAGDAAGLFPTITPSAGAGASTPQTTAPAQPSNTQTAPVSDASPVSQDTPVFTAQVTGLIALGLAIMLTVTRLSVRRRPGKPRG